jgi:hypothetical protein
MHVITLPKRLKSVLMRLNKTFQTVRGPFPLKKSPPHPLKK